MTRGQFGLTLVIGMCFGVAIATPSGGIFLASFAGVGICTLLLVALQACYERAEKRPRPPGE